MKKSFFAMVLCVALMGMFVACNKDKDNKKNEPTDPTEQKDKWTVNANGHEYVDLGDEFKFVIATMNIGATAPEEKGSYYAWGETETRTTYDWTTYSHCEGSNTTLTKYCTNSDHGTVDNKVKLEAVDDVAHTLWGGDWMIPDTAQFNKVIDKCTWAQATVNGIAGVKATGSNGNSVFFPFGGVMNGSNNQLLDVGHYQTKNLANNDWQAYLLGVSSSGSGKPTHCGTNSRNSGRYVRAIALKTKVK